MPEATELLPVVLSGNTHGGDSGDPMVFATTGRILPLGGEGSRSATGGLSRDDLLARAAERASDADFLRENPPYFWSAEISSSRVDAYFTVMQDSTLRNFAADAEAGVSFQNSHDIRQLPFGASLAGRFHNGRGDTPARTVADFYTVPGLKTNSVASDDLIRGIKSGVLRDVSVGFFGGETICSICNRDMEQGFLDWLFGDASEEEVCMHFPGMRYDVKGEDGKPTGEKQVCYGRIQNARLAEVSQVYKGATPNAGVLKAQRAADAGRLPPDTARVLETKYRIRLPGTNHVWAPGAIAAAAGTAAGTTTAAKETRTMPTENTEQRAEAEDTRAAAAPEAAAAEGIEAAEPIVRAILQQRGLAARWTGTGAAGVEATVAALSDEVVRLTGDVERLSPLADQVTAYRADLIEQVVLQGKRAQGTAFPEATFRAVLANASVEHLKETAEGFRSAANAIVAPGARVNATLSDDQHAPAASGANGAARRDAIPDTAFRTAR